MDPLKIFNVKDREAFLKLCQQKREEAQVHFFFNPDEVKKRRSKEGVDYSIIRVDEHFYMLSKGNALGEGSWGRVKLAVLLDEKGKFDQFFAVKREFLNLPHQQEETKIARAMGLAAEEKVERTSTTQKLSELSKKPMPQKYYTVMHYLGTSVFDLIEKDPLSIIEPTDIAIKFALEVVKLHSISPPLAHRDLKIENILVDDAQNVHLIDYGFTEENAPINRKTRILGTPDYLPKSWNKHQLPLMLIGKSLVNLDDFALKRSVLDETFPRYSLISKRQLEKISPVYYEVLQTKNETAAFQRPEGTLEIAAHLIAFKYALPLAAPLTKELANTLVQLYQAPLDEEEKEERIQRAYSQSIYPESETSSQGPTPTEEATPTRTSDLSSHSFFRKTESDDKKPTLEDEPKNETKQK